MRFSEFNYAATHQITPLLSACVHIPSWIDGLSQQRPYASTQALLDAATQQSQNWTWTEIETALATHPRIGEKKAKAELTEREAQFSDREQSGVKQDAQTQQALFEGNVAYEQKFGFIFLIKAAGLSSEQILSSLQQRLQHDLETEKKIVHEQLAAIALLRLSQGIQA
ncbi:2-oxo-4-hydroxy-4-carboxy-5-ureidoimidazoline decarboxylase [Acinetobacter ursingii]|uniref:2-oxo-4-hydroxy-4-carboxy-5-ureidoimidazoline decarboxylase n=1 Tax=Acinetobacter ursingii TaxID=108980 RepID=UPI0021D2DA48|nr:2-oxo-4-hydroxy-4-carboxy-5-ureidoimidazoline decarboxylase [Acinetobacter ursingii]MCU4358174.1 2-oxo-4-hydroxy-4-carboxy-5-ureidoimidazoline decarboxylase [Acinetobacter ursingii]MEC6124872.1 2-oxo-4-hydroxy-4-carboxy-5-ureidoimidazoline decarboxylase [Acinetobacter ursingii]MEC8056253.1 2-oxo-4-hydroxy-4-carboxy-5-ureidoimidazoline decarboxylase [Pseudomonadota bacterium]